MSGQNHSDMRRWAFLCAYNTRDNNPIKKHHCPQYTPLQKVNIPQNVRVIWSFDAEKYQQQYYHDNYIIVAVTTVARAYKIVCCKLANGINWVTIGSGINLDPVWDQAIIWTNNGLLWVGQLVKTLVKFESK